MVWEPYKTRETQEEKIHDSWQWVPQSCEYRIHTKLWRRKAPKLVGARAETVRAYVQILLGHGKLNIGEKLLQHCRVENKLCKLQVENTLCKLQVENTLFEFVFAKKHHNLILKHIRSIGFQQTRWDENKFDEVRLKKSVTVSSRYSNVGTRIHGPSDRGLLFHWRDFVRLSLTRWLPKWASDHSTLNFNVWDPSMDNLAFFFCRQSNLVSDQRLT